MNALYLSSTQYASGVVSVSLGIMELLKSKYRTVAYFKPIITSDEDSDISLMLDHFNLAITKQEASVYCIKEVEDLIAKNKTNQIIENIIDRFKHLQEKYDFVLIQGLNKEMITSTIGDDLNIEVAKNLSIPYISILNGCDKNNDTIIEEVKIENQIINNKKVSQMAMFVNKISKQNIDRLDSLIDNLNINIPVYTLPFIQEVANLTMGDVYNTLDAKLLYGRKKFLNQQIYKTKVASMTLDNFLLYSEDQDLIIVSGDRSDIISGTMLSLKSKHSKKIGGILLSGDLTPKSKLSEILCGLDNIPIAILSTHHHTHEAAQLVDNIKSKITSNSHSKISLILGHFTKYVDTKHLLSQLNEPSENITTPIMFEYDLIQQARKIKQHIVLPESGDDRILRAAEILLHRDIVDITLLGVKDEIVNKANTLGLDISKASFIDPKYSDLTEKFASKLFELRASKGMVQCSAAELIRENPNYFATMMVKEGYASGMVSGAVHTTADTVRPALQIIKTKSNVDIVSSVFFMCLDTKVLVYGDCAINQSPNSTELAQIAISSAATAKSFGIKPKVAMLSYSTGDSGSGEDVNKVIEATQLVKKQNIDFDIEGPIQYDAAIDKNVADKKLPNSKVAGVANVLIFPDLNTGNNTYKAVQRSSGAIAIGPILQGLNAPVNDLSRGCTVKDIVNTVIITAIQAQNMEN